MAVPELMRVLMDIEDLSWDQVQCVLTGSILTVSNIKLIHIVPVCHKQIGGTDCNSN